MTALAAIDRALGFALKAISVACFAALFLILSGNVISRYFQIWSIAWFDEIVEMLFAAMVFIGVAALWRENDHFRVDWLEAALGRRGGAYLRTMTILLSMAFFVVMALKGYDLTARSRAVTPILAVPVAYVYAVIPTSAALMLAYSVRDLVAAIKFAATQSFNR